LHHKLLHENLLSVSVTRLTPSVIRHHFTGKALRKYKMFVLKTICPQEPAYRETRRWNECTVSNSKHEMFGLLKVLSRRTRMMPLKWSCEGWSLLLACRIKKDQA